jgi:ABC-type sugar transport system substrate-binding protein
MKKSLVVACCAVLMCSIAGCSKGNGTKKASAESEKKLTVYFVGIMQGGPAWSQAEKGFADACTKLGWEGHYVAPSVPNDTKTMCELAETAVTNGAQALVGTFYSAEIFGDVLKEAKKTGVTIATTNCYIGPEYQNFWIGTDPKGMGTTQAKTLLSLVGNGKATVVYMQTLASTETQNMQFAAFKEYLKDYKNITVWGQEYCNSNDVEAAERISNLVKANPQINACVCADGNGSLGVANYVDESKNSRNFYSIGIDDSADILHYVQTGALDCTIAQNFYMMGYKSCELIKSVRDGTSVPYDNDSGTVVITADKVAEYAADKGLTL